MSPFPVKPSKNVELFAKTCPVCSADGGGGHDGGGNGAVRAHAHARGGRREEEEVARHSAGRNCQISSLSRRKTG